MADIGELLPERGLLVLWYTPPPTAAQPLETKIESQPTTTLKPLVLYVVVTFKRSR